MQDKNGPKWHVLRNFGLAIITPPVSALLSCTLPYVTNINSFAKA